ncbi:MAG: SDR family oxidoreductase [Cyanobacteria bacterium M_surface_9_m1_291]|nr:SDR family oxidoreductase [Cyanobacteria bacterium M_surface_9_m1_291]
MPTVLGAGGWVGSALVAQLQAQGQPVRAVARAGLGAWLGEREPASVLYTIGLTADFRSRPHATAEAHVGLLSQVLQRPGLEHLLLLSSTRVYGRSSATDETTPLPCLSSDPSDVYNLSKLLGEALVLQDPRPGCRVVRLSNVVGAGQPSTTFLGQVLEAAQQHGRVRLEQPASIAKDYVALSDVVRLLPQIAQGGRQRLYNLASGTNTSHREIAELLLQRGIAVDLHEPATPAPPASPIAITRLEAEFEPPAPGLEACRALILGQMTPGLGHGSAL